MNITVLGAGAWGTAIAIHLAQRHSVMLWDRNQKVVNETVKTRQNMTGLPGFVLPEAIMLTSRFEDAVAHGSGPDSLMIVATSVSGLRSVSGRLKNCGVINLIWLCKGFEENTGLLPNQVVAQTLSDQVDMGVLSGPSFAQEVAAGLPCALTIASRSMSLRKIVVEAANGGNMRIYSSDDVTRC